MNEKEIGLRIKKARELRDMTLQDVANHVGIAKSTVQRYEAGQIIKIKLPVIQSIAVALSVNPSWIIGKSDEMEPDHTRTSSNFTLTLEEEEHIKKYRTLDEYGKRNVDNILQNEYERCADSNIIPMQESPASYTVHTLAAHECAGATDEDKQHDYDLLEQIKKGGGGGKRE